MKLKVTLTRKTVLNSLNVDAAIFICRNKNV